MKRGADEAFATDSTHCSSYKYVIYIGNLLTSQLDNSEIEELLRTASNDQEVNSIKVFFNCIYVEYLGENEARKAANSLNGRQFKSFKLQAHYLRRISGDFDLFTRNNKEIDKFLSKQNDTPHQDRRIDCELVALDRQLRKYVDSINEKLKSRLFCFSTCVKYIKNEKTDENELDEPGVINEAIEEALSRSTLYLIFVDHKNEQFNSLTLVDLNRWRKRDRRSISVKENRNMPLNKALDYLKSDFYDYLNHLKRNSNLDEQEDDEECDGDDEDDKKIIFKFNKKQKKFLNLLLRPILDTASENVKLNDLDRLLTYLQKQKANLIEATLDAKKSDKQQPVEQIPSLLSIPYPPPLISSQPQPLMAPLMSTLLPFGAASNAPPALMSLLGQPPPAVQQPVVAPPLMSMPIMSLNKNFGGRL